MSKKPPVPEEQQSPFPIEEAPHDEPREESEAMAVVREMAAARKRRSSTARQIGVGAAIGVGSAAVVAALLYWRGNKK